MLHTISISPLSLPLEKRVFIGKPDPFDGLFGVFNDSLPDGWGRLLVDRILLKNHIQPDSLTVLDRLALVGNEGLGTLEYRPRTMITQSDKTLFLDEVSAECKKVFGNKEIETLELTRDIKECEKLYKLMCFNIFSHNRDDHSKNFSFIYSEKNGGYVLAPAYDLTYSNSINGEHVTTINGNGINPGIEDALAVAKNIGIKEKFAKEIGLETKDKVDKIQQ